MTEKKFIGSGFPGIKECIDEKNIMSKESREKREFAVRKIIPINQILTKHHAKGILDSEEFNIKDNIEYSVQSDDIDNGLNSKFTSSDLELINGPINKRSKSKKSKSKKSKSKKSKSKKSKSKKSKSRKSKSK